MQTKNSTPPHLVVIGGGFAGLWAVRALSTARVRITLVDRSNHHLFQPLLYQVATAGLSAPDIAAPLRHVLRSQANVTVRLAEATGIDLGQGRVQLADGRALSYDYLLVASGAQHAYFGHPEWAEHAPGLKTLDDALLIRRRVLHAFERAEAAAADGDLEQARAWLHFAVVGGGPTGVELAGTLAEIARHTLAREFRHIEPMHARVRLIEAGPSVLASFAPALREQAARQLRSLGVELSTGQPVSRIDEAGYTLGDQKEACRTVLWAAGVAASPLGQVLADGIRRADDTLTHLLDKAGRVRVMPDLSLPGHPNVFVAGDLAVVLQADGRPVPGVAPAAKQMGAHVAKVLRRRWAAQSAAEPDHAFRYRDYGNLATIGRMAAVVEVRRLQLSGLLAWWFWLAAHVFFLIGFRNRLLVLLNWAWAYWTYQRHARIVLGKERESVQAPDKAGDLRESQGAGQVP
jgi:NADH:ubiquinone reductase (H+-translocating)